MENQFTVQNKQGSRNYFGVSNILSFTRASNHAVSIPKNSNNSLLVNADWTIRLICTYGSNTEYIYYDYDGSKGFYIRATGGNTVEFFISDGTNNNTVSVAVPSTFANSEKIITVTYTQSSKTVVLTVGDFGSTTQVVTLTSTIHNAQAVTLGNNFALSSGLEGLIGVVTLWNKVLSTFELNSLNQEIAVIPSTFKTNLVGYWQFNGNGTLVATDSVNTYNVSITNNPGTLVNYQTIDDDNIVNTVRVNFYDRRQKPEVLVEELKKLGTMEMGFIYGLPVVTVDTNFRNTVDTVGTTTFTRVWDWSGNNRHQTVPSKAQAPAFDQTTKGAKFTANQYFNKIEVSGVNTGTILIELDGATVTPTVDQNPIGTFHGIGAITNTLWFGNFTGGIANETLTINLGGGNFYTTAAIAAGQQNTIAFYTNASSSYMYLNGTALATTGSPTNQNIGFQLGRRVNTTQYYTGTVRKVFIYSTALTAAQVIKATNLIKSTN